LEDQEANSDNEYVGMFDEEEQEVEEREEEVDQLTVVSIILTRDCYACAGF